MTRILRSSKPPRPPSPAERWYLLGADLVRVGRYQEALKPLEQALAYSVEEPDAPFVRTLRSHYGLVITLARGEVERGQRLCEQAVMSGDPEPQLLVNLARIYMRLNRRDLVAQVVRTALAIDPHDQEALAIEREIGARQSPVFSFLRRGNPLNRVAGKLRRRLAQS